MEFQEVVRRRRMVRTFDDRPIPPEIVDRILRNAQRAPSAGFSQGWAFLALEKPEDRELFWDSIASAEQRKGFGWPGLFKAPLIIVPLSHMDSYLDRYAEPDKGWSDRDHARWTVPYWHVDTGFATLLMLLTVVDENLGANFFAVFRPEGLRKAFGIPDEYTPVGALAIGYPLPDKPSPSLKRGRKPAETVVHRGRW